MTNLEPLRAQLHEDPIDAAPAEMLDLASVMTFWLEGAHHHPPKGEAWCQSHL
jgi:hypothetical protein